MPMDIDEGEGSSKMVRVVSKALGEKSIREISLEEIVSEIRQLEEELPRPFVQVVTKVIKSKGRYYTYAYLQWREGKTVRTVYLGKRIPENIAERIRLQNRLKILKKEFKRRMAGIKI